MEKRELGKTGIQVSALALGCFSMTKIYGNPDPEEGVRTIHRALEMGVNHLDTADVYQNGDNEKLVGGAIAGKRDQYVVATKFGQVVRPDGTRTIDGSPEYIRKSCEGSLQRLGTDYIDLYYMHRIDADTPIEESIGALADLVKEGKIRAIGISEASVESLRRGSKVHHIAALQSEYSLWTRFVEKEHLPLCKELGTSLLAYAPIGRGFLSGSIRSDKDLGEVGETRRNHPRFRGDNLERNLALLGPIEEMARQKGCTMAQLAIAWVRKAGPTVFPLAGSGKVRHLEENVAAMDVQLSADERRQLTEAVSGVDVVGERYPEGMMEHLNV